MILLQATSCDAVTPYFFQTENVDNPELANHLKKIHTIAVLQEVYLYENMLAHDFARCGDYGSELS